MACDATLADGPVGAGRLDLAPNDRFVIVVAFLARASVRDFPKVAVADRTMGMLLRWLLSRYGCDGGALGKEHLERVGGIFKKARGFLR